jgi:endonuclease YncB( thermonuclease family)
VQDLNENAICEISATTSVHEKTKSLLYQYDGDTFKTADTIRLIGVDAPELSQFGGNISQNYLARLIANKSVILVPRSEERDNHGGLLRYVYVNGVCINELLIKNGYA